MKHTEFHWQEQAEQKIYAQAWQPDGAVRASVSLVHGLGEHGGRYQHVAEFFAHSGIAVVSCDLPGHGRSEGSRGYFSYNDSLAVIDRLVAETDRLFPGVPHFIYGHSLGGALTLHYVLKRRPDLCGAIVTSPGLASGTPVPSWKLAVAKLMAKIAPAFSMANGLDRKNLSHDPAVLSAYDADPLVHDRISAVLGRDLLSMGSWMTEQANTLSVPLLLMQGSKDYLVSPPATAAFAKRVPPDKLTYRVWEDFYHETHNELGKEQVLQLMVDWLDQHV